MHTRLILIAALTFLAACASTHKPAPGASPDDMTAEGHREAAAKEESEAAMHERRAEQANKLPEEVEQEKAAEEHRDVADQHEKAAETVEAGE